MKKIFKIILFCIAFAIFSLPFTVNAQNKTNLNSETRLTEFELEILKEVNRARQSPEAYITHLIEIRKSMNGKVRHIAPDIRLLTLEGIESVDDAIADLKRISAVPSFKVSEIMSKAARKHLADLIENPKLKHFGKDGSDPLDRLNDLNIFPNRVGETILRNTDSAREIVLRIIIDDGIKSRSHRKNLFSENFNTIGIAYGIGKKGEPIVVMNFADLPEPKTVPIKDQKQN